MTVLCSLLSLLNIGYARVKVTSKQISDSNNSTAPGQRPLVSKLLDPLRMLRIGTNKMRRMCALIAHVFHQNSFLIQSYSIQNRSTFILPPPLPFSCPIPLLCLWLVRCRAVYAFSLLHSISNSHIHVYTVVLDTQKTISMDFEEE